MSSNDGKSSDRYIPYFLKGHSTYTHGGLLQSVYLIRDTFHVFFHDFDIFNNNFRLSADFFNKLFTISVLSTMPS